ncbi:MAG TPA: DnaJ domain-containing protein [Kofleriaceae bacterium]|jgi:tetratricopeptide (TPR) repeat protein|nr:DnaJ domain-containing protein [Kofleriaceae bacterium]
MGAVPNEIPELGKTTIAPRQNPEFDPLKRSELSSEDYYVWSRVDGRSTFKDLILMTGLPPAQAIDVLRRLRGWGALLLPNETPDSVRLRAASSTNLKSRPRAETETASPPPPPPPPVELGALHPAERAALAEEVDIPEEERKRIIHLRRLAHAGDYYGLLGVGPEADKREVKRAYFRISKDLHPDRYYQRKTGSFGAWVEQVFEIAARAYEVLGDPAERATYDEERTGAQRRESPSTTAARLYDQAVAAEARGASGEALALFAQALRVDPQARFFRRAAACAAGARQWPVAEEYARKAAELAPHDPSVQRLLAGALRGQGKFSDAEETLVYALGLKIDNDRLVAELEEDLADVRKRLSTRR